MISLIEQIWVLAKRAKKVTREGPFGQAWATSLNTVVMSPKRIAGTRNRLRLLLKLKVST